MTRLSLLSWIIIVPVEKARLEREVAALRRERFGELDDDDAPMWELAAAGQRSAVLSREAGAAGEELEVAPALAKRLGVSAISLALEGYEDGAFLAREHRAGKHRDLKDDPMVILRREGFSALVAEQAPSAESDGGAAGGSVLVIDGVTPDAAARALELKPGGPVTAQPIARGTLVTSAARDAGDLQDLLPAGFEHVSYSVMWDPPRFAVFVATPDGELRAFERPAVETDLPRLDAVCGETEPAAILRALGVPPDAISFPV